jgi:hypothetical protein
MECDGRKNIVSKYAAGGDSSVAVVALVMENKWTELQYMPSYFLPPQDIPGSLIMVTDTRH